MKHRSEPTIRDRCSEQRNRGPAIPRAENRISPDVRAPLPVSRRLSISGRPEGYRVFLLSTSDCPRMSSALLSCDSKVLP